MYTETDTAAESVSPVRRLRKNEGGLIKYLSFPQITIIVLLCVLVILMLVPILFMIVSSLKAMRKFSAISGGCHLRPNGIITALRSPVFGDIW